MEPKQFSVQWKTQGLNAGFTLFFILLIVGAIAPDWLVNGVLILIALAFLTPILGFFGFQWWLQRNLVQENCPVCNYAIQGVQGMQVQCPNCGEVLKGKAGGYDRVTPPGTVEVTAVEVSGDESVTKMMTLADEEDD